MRISDWSSDVCSSDLRSLKFLGFNFSVSQAAVVFPFIIQAQRFFSQQISLGDLMQTAQAFGRLQDNLSFFRNAYDDFATRSEEHTSELQSLMRISYAVFCLKKKTNK